MLLVCQAAAVTSGVQGVVPERRRKNAYLVVAGLLPPPAVAVQVMASYPSPPAAGDPEGQPARGLTWTFPGLT